MQFNHQVFLVIQPFGVNQPGPSVKYETTKPNGAPTQGCATQLSQSAHFALNLPYTIFGLGAMPNFVDQLSVGIPTNTVSKTWYKWGNGALQHSNSNVYQDSGLLYMSQ